MATPNTPDDMGVMAALQRLSPEERRRFRAAVVALQRHGLGNCTVASLADHLVRVPDCKAPSDASSTRSASEVRTTSLASGAPETVDVGQLTKTKEAADLLLRASLEMSTRGFADIGDLITTLIKGAAQLLQADRCSLFRVEDDDLVSSAPGKDGTDTIRVRVGSGIAGHVAQTGEIVNIPDAYADPRFNEEVDKRTGYRTVSLLCGPLLFQGQVIAVVQLLNKTASNTGHVPFTDADESLFRGFASFAGVALSNAYLYHDALGERRKTEVLLDSVHRLGNAGVHRVDEVTHVIREAATELLEAERCTLFVVDRGAHCLYASTDDGQHISTPIGKGIAGTVCETQETLNIADVYAHQLFNPDVDVGTGYVSRNILCMPVKSPEEKNEVIGVVQVLNKFSTRGGFTRSDEQFLAFFTQFAALHLTNAKRYAFLVQSQETAMHLVEMQSSMGSKVQPRGGIMAADDVNVATAMAIELTPEEKRLVLTDEFDVHEYGMGTTKFNRLVPLAAWIFERLGLLDAFKVSRFTFFRFLLTVAGKYRAVPYHSFVHAFDVTQTIACFLAKGGAQHFITRLDAFALLVSSLLHDVDHMGLNNSFHTKVETPLGFLSTASGTTSVLEVHHCNLALEILAMEPTAIFAGLNEEDHTTAYKSLISTILATDMAKHKELVSDFLGTCRPVYDKENPEHRRLATSMLMKAADLSNLTKPFNIARLWSILVTDEFYYQGDTEKAVGCGVTPSFNREAKPELADTQLGFIDNCALEFYGALASVFPGLSYTVDQLRLNRARWAKVKAGGGKTRANS